MIEFNDQERKDSVEKKHQDKQQRYRSKETILSIILNPAGPASMADSRIIDRKRKLVHTCFISRDKRTGARWEKGLWKDDC